MHRLNVSRVKFYRDSKILKTLDSRLLYASIQLSMPNTRLLLNICSTCWCIQCVFRFRYPWECLAFSGENFSCMSKACVLYCITCSFLYVLYEIGWLRSVLVRAMESRSVGYEFSSHPCNALSSVDCGHAPALMFPCQQAVWIWYCRKQAYHVIRWPRVHCLAAEVPAEGQGIGYWYQFTIKAVC